MQGECNTKLITEVKPDTNWVSSRTEPLWHPVDDILMYPASLYPEIVTKLNNSNQSAL